jgi:hypothetical protein
MRHHNIEHVPRDSYRFLGSRASMFGFSRRRRHISAMTRSDLNDPLSPAEFESLRELAAGLKWRPLPSLHTAKLLRLGYARDAVGGLSISELGQLRIAKGS